MPLETNLIPQYADVSNKKKERASVRFKNIPFETQERKKRGSTLKKFIKIGKLVQLLFKLL